MLKQKPFTDLNETKDNYSMKYRLLACTLALGTAMSASYATELTREAKTSQMTADLHAYTAELSSDAYEGREPGTAGEQKTVDYLTREFAALGLKPGNKGSWFQEVPITSVSSDPNVVMQLRGKGLQLDLEYGPDMMAFTSGQSNAWPTSTATIITSPLTNTTPHGI
jgi:hypothetical protein